MRQLPLTGYEESCVFIQKELMNIKGGGGEGGSGSSQSGILFLFSLVHWNLEMDQRFRSVVSFAVPDEFSFDPVTKTYGDPQRRPEIRSATIEFIAPSEYMVSSCSVTCSFVVQYCTQS